jgi:hypothetical protein
MPCYWTVTLTVVFAAMPPLVPVTVTTYVPAEVPPEVVTAGVPPHPIAAVAAIKLSTTRLSSACQFFRRRGSPNSSTAAASVPPPPKVRKRSSGLWSAAVEEPVVFTVSVAVTAVPPEIALGWPAEQVGGSTAPAGLDVTEQASATLPVNPPEGVMVIVDVPVDPGEAIVIAGPVNVNPVLTVTAFTVTGIVAVSTALPDVPVTVAV